MTAKFVHYEAFSKDGKTIKFPVFKEAQSDIGGGPCERHTRDLKEMNEVAAEIGRIGFGAQFQGVRRIE
jgi:hypothetical protein